MRPRDDENTLWTYSQDYGADEILYIARTALFNKTNQLIREIMILFEVYPQLFTGVLQQKNQKEPYMANKNTNQGGGKDDNEMRIQFGLILALCQNCAILHNPLFHGQNSNLFKGLSLMFPRTWGGCGEAPSQAHPLSMDS